jgi:hypothetical protein
MLALAKLDLIHQEKYKVLYFNKITQIKKEVDRHHQLLKLQKMTL